MKTLSLVRHAKSSWEDSSLADRDRPLNKRGLRDAPRMGKRLRQRKIVPDIMISSPAKRAVLTAGMIADAIGYPKEQIVVEGRLYACGARGVLAVVQSLNDQTNHAMIIGHNPELTELVNQLTHVDVENMPTCGMAHIRFDTDSWADIETIEAELLDFDYPKRMAD